MSSLGGTKLTEDNKVTGFELTNNEHKLVRHRGILDDDLDKVDDSQINEVNCVMVEPRGGIQIFVKTMDGKTVSIKVLKKDAIIYIKKKFEEKTGLSPDGQQLVYQGQLLDEDDTTVDEYQIIERSVINIMARLRGGPLIYARTKDGRTVTLEITKNDRIIDLKKKIQEKIELLPDEQRLVYQGGILDDNMTVGYYQIVENSFINIVARLREMLVYVKTMDEKTVSIEVTRNDRIIDINKKIQEKIGLSPDEQKIIYHGILLKGDMTVGEYQITENSVINVVARLRGGIPILIKTMDGKTISFEVTKNDRIIDLKNTIREEIGVSPDEQKLVYQSEILEDNMTFDNYQIVENSVINFMVKLREMLIYAKTMDGRSYRLEVTNYNRIIEIKKKIEEMLGLSPGKQQLSYQGVKLEDGDTIDHYGICENDTICVVEIKNFVDINSTIQDKIGVSQDELKLVYQGGILEDNNTVDEYQIPENDSICVVEIKREITMFAHVSGKMISLVVKENDKIIDIKKKIHEKIGIPPDLQRITYNGIILDDDLTADYYEMEKDSHIIVSGIIRHCEMRIFAKTTEGETIELKLVEGDKIIDIKKKIHEKIGLSPNEHDLLYDGCVLDDNETVGCRLLHDNKALHIQKKSPPRKTPRCILM